MGYFKDTVPRLTSIMGILDGKVRGKFDSQLMAVTDRGDRIHMAHISIHYGFGANGMATLHVDILKEDELYNSYKTHLGKFDNRTNGIAFCRWPLHCDPQLSAFISGLVGKGFKKGVMEFQNLNDLVFTGSIKTLYRLLSIKGNKEEDLAIYLKGAQGLNVSP